MWRESHLNATEHPQWTKTDSPTPEQMNAMMGTINSLLPAKFSKSTLDKEYNMLNHASGLKCNYEPYDLEKGHGTHWFEEDEHHLDDHFDEHDDAVHLDHLDDFEHMEDL